jgi:nicotinamide riboside kinase
MHLDTGWVAEYGRELWEQKGGALAFDDMLAIGRQQLERETQAAGRANRWLICDTSPLTTSLYSEMMFGRVDPRLLALAERSYDHVLLCAPDFEFVQDGTRRDAAFRERQHAWYVHALAQRGIACTLLRGSLDQRIGEAAALLRARQAGSALEVAALLGAAGALRADRASLASG